MIVINIEGILKGIYAAFKVCYWFFDPPLCSVYSRSDVRSTVLVIPFQLGVTEANLDESWGNSSYKPRGASYTPQEPQ